MTKVISDGSTLAYSSRFGGSGADYGNTIAVDNSGHAYVTGQTASSDFPLIGTLEDFSGTHMISSMAIYTTSMAFVVRMNKQGSGRFYSSYLGGSGGDAGNAIAVDGIGDVLLAGGTGSSDLLTLRAPQPSNAGGQDGFVVGLDATTRHLVYGYDGLDRLSGVTETLGNAYSYTYDIAGNRTNEWLNGVNIQQAQYNPADELITLTTPQTSRLAQLAR